MARPDGGLIQETNLQYYAGAQIIYTSVAGTTAYTFTFNTTLVLGSATSWAPTDPAFGLNNFRIYTIYMNLLKELFTFLKFRRKLWLAPIIFVMLVLGVLLIAAQSSVIAPFIYTIF